MHQWTIFLLLYVQHDGQFLEEKTLSAKAGAETTYKAFFRRVLLFDWPDQGNS